MPPTGSSGHLGPRPGAGVAGQRLARQLLDPDPAEPRGGAGEPGVDQLAVEPDRLEGLGAAVGGDGRDAELREHLQEARVERLDQGRLRVLVDQLPAPSRASGRG